MSETITWLHLSDLHAGKPSHGWDARRVTETLVDDLTDLEQKYALHPDFIFFTGDAGFGQFGTGPGETLGEQFETAQRFFESVRTAFSPAIRRSRVFLVPGNHDVNRKAVGEDLTDWLDRQEDAHQVNMLLEKKGSQWQRYMERLAEYQTFLRDNGYSHLLGDPEHLVYAIVHKVRGVNVGIAGLNSAWSACRESKLEKGKLWMGSRWQLERVSSQLKGADLKIALLHHPPNWLVEPEDGTFWRELERDFQFILHGHEHQEWVRAGSDGWTRIAAGASYERSDKPNGYNMVRLDRETGTGEVWLREYDPRGGGWVPTRIYGKTDDRGVWPLKDLDWLSPKSGTSPSSSQPTPRHGEEVSRGGGVRIGNVVGGIHGSVIAARDVTLNSFPSFAQPNDLPSFARPEGSYNIGAIRRLLLAAFTSDTLYRFCLDRPVFEPITNDFGSGHGLSDMVDRVIDYCRTRMLFDTLLEEIRMENQEPYRRFAPYRS